METTPLGIKLDQENDKLLVNLEKRLSKISPSSTTASTPTSPTACSSQSSVINNENNSESDNGIVVMDTNENPKTLKRNLAFPLPFNLRETEGPFQNPFRLFPDFVWLNIFNQCRNPKDFKTFIDTCPQFHGLLQKDRVKRLFPEVIKIILDNLNPRVNIRHQFSPQEILKMRFVCTAWSNGIKDYLQNHPSHLSLESFPEDQDHPVQPYFRSGQKAILENFKLHWHSTLVLKVNNPGNFLHFMTKPLQIKDYFCDDELRTRKNPIVTREFIFNDVFSKNLAADIETQGRRVPLDIHNLMEHFLDWTGSHIWYVTFEITNITVATYYQRLYRWLTKLPNLKSLKLHYRHNHAGNNFADNAAKNMVLSQLRRETEAASIPFATVENIKLLDLKNVPAPIVRELLRTCVNVEKLKIDYDSSHDRKLRVDNEWQLLFPENSASFGVHCKEMMIRIRGFDDFVHFETSGLGKSCPLETVFLHCRALDDDIDDPGYSTCPSWQRIFTLLGTRFGATLKHLKLSLPKAVTLDDTRMIMEQFNVYRLELPHLKSLRVFVPNLASIDFLLPLGKTLEELEVMITHGEEMSKRDRQKEIIKFHGFHEKMPRSNIWGKMPNLREIMIDKLRPVEANSNTFIFVRYFYKRTQK